LPGGVDPDAGQREQLRRGGTDQRGQLAVQLVDLALQRLPAAGQRAQRQLGGGGRVVEQAGAERRADPDPLPSRMADVRTRVTLRRLAAPIPLGSMMGSDRSCYWALTHLQSAHSPS
jgi:hypothetical protein